MKRLTFAGMALACLTFTAVSTASAQSIQLRASIPFEFQVGSKVLPAGEYTLLQSGSSKFMLVSNQETNDSTAYGGTHPLGGGSSAHAKDGSVLVFNRYGNHYFLREIWREGDGTGLGFAESRSEKSAMNIAAVRPETIVLQARR
jgi:hypothetical protein